MNPHKRRKLHNKRTPWIKSRHGREAMATNGFARALASVFHALYEAECDRQISEMLTNGVISTAPMHGSKTQ